MSSTTTISIEKFARLIGTPKCPAVIDVRNEEDFAADPRLIPGGGAARNSASSSARASCSSAPMRKEPGADQSRRFRAEGRRVTRHQLEGAALMIGVAARLSRQGERAGEAW